MKFKHIITVVVTVLFISSLNGCSTNQNEPAVKVSDNKVEVAEGAKKAPTIAQSTADRPKSSGASQSTGGRIGIYVVKLVVSSAITYFVTKAIVDAVKKDITDD